MIVVVDTEGQTMTDKLMLFLKSQGIKILDVPLSYDEGWGH